jgi:hypothetical protein
MTIAHRILAAVRALLGSYEEHHGISADYYCPQRLYHPMAEGKYLACLATLRAQNVLGEGEYLERLASSRDRLRESDFSLEPDTSCWGLGFAYKGVDQREPFLITTCIVANGLLDTLRPDGVPLLEKTLRWLDRYSWWLDVPCGVRSIPVPAFSPHQPMAVINVIACWVGVLRRIRPKLTPPQQQHIDQVSAWIRSLYREPVGWAYDLSSTRIDLLHQCYIFNALAEEEQLASLEELALQTFSAFSGVGSMLDKADIVEKQEALRMCCQSAHVSLLPNRGHWVVRHHDEARAWSYGELLVMLSRFARYGSQAAFWRGAMRRLAELVSARVLSSDPMNDEYRKFFRNAMHLAHGLTEALAVIRGGAPGRTAGEN